ncbi:MAG TPA: DUF3037 domain-containing protein [Armatimonadota bacterium]|jgi:hypothetical protein
MKHFQYAYSAIQYVHDPVTDERLNIGVLLHAPEVGFLGIEVERRIARLSAAFPGFDRATYTEVTQAIRAAARRVNRQPDMVGPRLGSSLSVTDICEFILPDQDMSYRFSPARGGIGMDPEQELAAIFNRLVRAYIQRPNHGDSDEEVWRSFSEPLRERRLTDYLQKKLVQSRDFEVEFDYGLKNEAWTVLQPLSFRIHSDRIQEKATKWLGNGVAINESGEIAKMHFLLGAPDGGAGRSAYIKAKNLLDRISVPHEFVEESDADSFADYIATFVGEHNVEMNPRLSLSRIDG